MWKHNQEAVDAVEQFNEKVIEAIGEDKEFSSGHCMMMTTDGSSTIIEFMGVVLWNSEDDEREFYNDKDESEPLLGFLERQAKEELNRFSRIFK